MLIHYISDIAEPRNGFKFNVSIGKCGGSYSQGQGIILSKGYPTKGAYDKRSVCDYVIKAAANSDIQLNFDDIHLPFDINNNSNSDRLDIYAVEDEVEVQLFSLNGSTKDIPKDLETGSNKIIIRFTTFGNNTNYRGFKLRYSTIASSCYRDITGVSGNLISAFRSRHVMFVCRWRITVPKGQRVSLQFTNMESLTEEQKQFR